MKREGKIIGAFLWGLLALQSLISMAAAADGSPASSRRMSRDMVSRLAKGISSPSSSAARAFAGRLAVFLSRRPELRIPPAQGLVLAKRWLKSQATLRARYGKAAELYLVIGDRVAALGWTDAALRKRLSQARSLPSYAEFQKRLARDKFLMRKANPSRRSSSKPDSSQEYQVFGFLNQSAEIAHRVLWESRKKPRLAKLAAPSFGGAAGAAAAAVAVGGGRRGHLPKDAPAQPANAPVEPPHPTFVASAGFDTKSLYEDGALIVHVPGGKGQGLQELSIKVYSRQDMTTGQMVDEIGVFNITDHSHIFGQRFPVLPPTNGKIYLADLSSSPNPNKAPSVPLTIGSDGGISLGSAATTSLSDLLARRRAQVAQSGLVAAVGGQNFRVIGQGGAKGSLLYFACDKDGKLLGNGQHPDAMAAVNQIGQDGLLSTVTTPVPLGFIGKNQNGKSQFWFLQWDPVLQNFVPVAGRAPGPPWGPVPSSGTIAPVGPIPNPSPGPTPGGGGQSCSFASFEPDPHEPGGICYYSCPDGSTAQYISPDYTQNGCPSRLVVNALLSK